jgi:4-hydroxyphenylacetate 3-monooxygenase oxygenase component
VRGRNAPIQGGADVTPHSQTSALRDNARGERSGLKTGRSYIESLRDGREVWVHGEKVADVTKHPAFANVAKTIGDLYDLQHQDATRDLMTYVDEDGVRGSISYMPPRSPEDLLRRRKNTEVWTEQSFGMFGRLPDFCSAMIVGFHDLHDELNALHPGFGDNATNYLKYARQNDLVLSHALHDPNMDKTLRPSQDPDRCLRIVKERDDGIVVRGARFSTLGPLANEVVVAPTYVLAENEEEFAIWFACSMDTPGLKQVCRDPISLRPSTADHPLSSKYDEQDVLLIFDDVLIPWERVFLMRKPKEANVLFRSRVMSWAGYASVLQLLARLELLIGTAHLIAETGGIANRPFVALEMGELASYAGMFKGLLRAAEIDCIKTPAGHYGLGDTSHLRPLITMTSERIINIFEHVATSSIVFTPTAEDFGVPELKKLLDVYGRGKGVEAEYRYKLCRLAWELSASSFGGRQQLYERLHSGSPEVIVSGAYQRYDKSKGIAMVKQIIGQ